jgi:hypothetical protein
LFEIKITTQGISTWYFHAYMYYSPKWSSLPELFTTP